MKDYDVESGSGGYTQLGGGKQVVSLPSWKLSHRGHVVALAASDDYDGSGYIDYVISGGSNGHAHVWMFDDKGSHTYRLFAKLYHDPLPTNGNNELCHRVNKPPNKHSPVETNSVVTVAAGREMCITGTADGRVFAWCLREEDASRRQKLPPLSLQSLSRGCAVFRAFDVGDTPSAMSIEMLDVRKGCTFAVLGHVYRYSIKIFEGSITGGKISLHIKHELNTGNADVIDIARVPSHPNLVLACGTKMVGKGNEEESHFIQVWNIPHDTDARAEKMADVELPLSETPLEIVVSEKRKRFGDLDLATMKNALDEKNVLDRLRTKELVDEDRKNVPHDKIYSFIAFLAGKDETEKKYANEFMTALHLQAYTDHAVRHSQTFPLLADKHEEALALELFKEKLRLFPEQLVVTAGSQHVFTAELSDHDSNVSLTMLPDHHTQKDVSFINIDTIGKNAVTVDHNTCEVWPLDDFVEGTSPGLKMRVPIIELVNPDKVTAPLCVASTARGREEGELDQLICGMENGAIIVWDMFGMRGGEMIAELRSSHFYSEVLLPPLLEFIAFVQLTGFAFSSWNDSSDGVRIPREAGRIASCDIRRILDHFDISFHRETWFWVQAVSILSFMAFFVIYVAFGGQETIFNAIRRQLTSKSFREEESHLMHWRNAQVKRSQDSKGEEALVDSKDAELQKEESQDRIDRRGSKVESLTSSGSLQLSTRTFRFQVDETIEEMRHCYCAHLTVLFLRGLLRSMSVLIKVICTIFVVPISKLAAEIYDCNYDEESQTKYLAFAPGIKCYDGAHGIAAIIGCIVIPTFFFTLMPYAVCGGDASYVQRDEVLDPKQWRGNAEKKASVRYTGFLHPVKEKYFFAQMVTFSQKVAFPIITLETTTRPLLQKILLLSIGFAVCLFFGYSSVVFNPRARALMQGSRWLTCFVILCSTYAVYISDNTGHWPREAVTVCLFGSLAISLITLAMFCARKESVFYSVDISTLDAQM